MYELNKKTISTLIISILMLSMALSAMPMAVAKVGPTIHIDPELVASAGATATWENDPITGGTQGKVAKLTQVGDSADHYAYVRVSPASTITLSALTAANMPTFKYYVGAGTYPPALELRFEDPSSNGWVDVTVFAYGPVTPIWPTTVGTWYDTAATAYKLTMGHYAVAYGLKSDGATGIAINLGSNPLSAIISQIEALDTTAANWVLTRVTPQVGWQTVGAQTVYVDDIKIGSVTYNLANCVDSEGKIRVGDKVFASGTSRTLGGLVKIYWDSVKDWDGTTGAGYLAETYAVGTSYSVEITIPAGTIGTHYVIVKDIEASATASTTITVKPKIVLSPTAGIPLDTITVTGTGYGNAETITIGYPDLLVTVPSTVTTTALGSFTATFVIPSTVITTKTITATGLTSAGSATATLTIGTVITLTPNKGLPGTTVTVAGRAFTPSSTVDITWGTILLLVNDYPVDSSGAFTTTITVPTGLTAYEYTVTATDDSTDHKTDSDTFTLTGVTAITLSPKSGLSGTTVTVKGDWFTKSKTVTIYLDGVSVGTTTAGAVAPYSITKDVTIPVATTFGAHTIKAMDSEGVYATATFTVSERVTVIETRSTTYMPGDTISFNIHSTVEFRTVGADHIVIKIYDPDDYMFWSVNWEPELDEATDTYVVPYSAQVVSGLHLTLPSDAMAGLWKWNATYYLTDVATKVVKQGSFTVKAVTASMIDEKITALEQSINLLGVQILAAQTAATAAQTAATTAGTKADAALTAAQAATTAAQGAKTSADSATTSANAAKASADAAKAATDSLTTLVYVAIGASAIAALAAIFAVMQISKKIA